VCLSKDSHKPACSAHAVITSAFLPLQRHSSCLLQSALASCERSTKAQCSPAWDETVAGHHQELPRCYHDLDLHECIFSEHDLNYLAKELYKTKVERQTKSHALISQSNSSSLQAIWHARLLSKGTHEVCALMIRESLTRSTVKSEQTAPADTCMQCLSPSSAYQGIGSMLLPVL